MKISRYNPTPTNRMRHWLIYFIKIILVLKLLGGLSLHWEDYLYTFNLLNTNNTKTQSWGSSNMMCIILIIDIVMHSTYIHAFYIHSCTFSMFEFIKTTVS